MRNVIENKGKTVNSVVGQDPSSSAQSNQDNTSSSNVADGANEAVFVRMDQLQNQLNQVMQMMQQVHQNPPSGMITSISIRRHKFIASVMIKFKAAWVVDSGATDHICITLTLMHNIRTCNPPILITLPNGQHINVTICGSVRINKDITLTNVFYVPTFSYNLLSVSTLTKHMPVTAIFTSLSCHFQVLNKRIAHGNLCEGLYIIYPEPHAPTSSTSTILNTTSDKSELWHSRLGHPAFKTLKQIKCISNSCNQTDVSCHICPLSKQHALSFPLSTSHASQPFDLIHIDLRGPYKQITLNKCTYFLTIVDNFSRGTWTYLLPSKHHTTSQLKVFFSYVQNQFNKTIKTIKSDNGTEFLNNQFLNFTQQHGIIHQTSCPYTPQQNARVERKHKQLLEIARSIRFQANFPIHFWGQCILTATYLLNRLPTKPLAYKSPYEYLYGIPPSLDHLRIIGCQTYPHQHLTDKFAARAIPSVLVGSYLERLYFLQP